MTERITLFFEPLDVLQFRDHRPFDAGLDVTAESVFPMPSVFYGHLRSVLVAERCPDFTVRGGTFDVPKPWAELLGGPQKVGTLVMRGPLFARRVGARVEGSERIEPLFCPPRDLVCTKQQEWHVLALRDWPGDHGPRIFRGDANGMTAAKSAVPWCDERTDKRAPKILLTPKGASAYFQATDKVVFEDRHTLFEKDVFLVEERVGIALDPSTRTAAEGMFYVTRPFRLHEGYGFGVDVEVSDSEVRAGLKALHGRAFPLGGKGHRARVHVSDGALLPAELDGSVASGDKRWLLSPLPIGPVVARVETIVTDRAVLVGGYDFAKHAPKALRRALPRGAVIRLRPGQTLGELFENDEDRRMGYGTALGGSSARSDA